VLPGAKWIVVGRSRRSKARTYGFHHILLRGLRDLREVDDFIFGGCHSHRALQNGVK
jgi:hypothetical protein